MRHEVDDGVPIPGGGGPDEAGPGVSVAVHRYAAEVWRSWVDPARLAEWFGAADGRLDHRAHGVRIDFGDGDFFLADIVAVHAPRRLDLRWRFLGVDDVDEVTVVIEPVLGDGTWVRVADSGLSGPDAAALSEGWRDYLARLKHYCETGERSRYEWSPDIAFGFSLAGPTPSRPPVRGTDLLGLLGDTVAASARHGGIAVGVHRLAEAESEFVLSVDHPRQEGSTEARLLFMDDARRIQIEHTGWEALTLPRPGQIAARRAWVGLWLRAVHDLRLVS